MATAIDPIVTYAVQSPRRDMKDRLRDWIPRLVLAPSFALILVFVYGFNLWTLLISFTNSKAFTNFSFIGWANYARLWTWTFQTDPPSNWYTALVNMVLFGGLYVIFCLALGLALAILLAPFAPVTLPSSRFIAGDPMKSATNRLEGEL